MKSTCSLAALLAACALLALSGAANAQTAQTSSSADSAAACPQGWVRNSDGDCDPPKGEVLGFSLAGLNAAASSQTAVPASAPAASASAVVAAKAPVRGHSHAEMHDPVYRGGDSILANFALGSADTGAAAQDHVQTFVSHLGKGLEDKRVIVNGHTDARGSNRLNLRLSRERAEAVKTLLVKAGVAQSAVEVRGHGASHLLRPRHPYAAANRRVDVMVVPN